MPKKYNFPLKLLKIFYAKTNAVIFYNKNSIAYSNLDKRLTKFLLVL